MAMSMILTVPDEIAQAVRELSKASGAAPEAILVSALQAHFPPIPDELRAEFEAWEQASDEDDAKLGL